MIALLLDMLIVHQDVEKFHHSFCMLNVVSFVQFSVVGFYLTSFFFKFGFGIVATRSVRLSCVLFSMPAACVSDVSNNLARSNSCFNVKLKCSPLVLSSVVVMMNR